MKTYGLIGKSLKHSFSADYFAKKFLDENIENCEYKLFELSTIENLQFLLDKELDLKGFNVTIPYKEEILSFIDEFDEIIQELKAVNTVKIYQKDNKKSILKGYNTDVYGFEKMVIPKLENYHKKALILGTGGAAKAVEFVFKKNNIEFINATRNSYSDKNKILYDKIDKNIFSEYLIFVNTTPLGMYPNINEFPNIDYDLITKNHIFIDLIYNPSKTLFLEKAEHKGSKTFNGYEMLCLQAEKSWEIWNSSF